MGRTVVMAALAGAALAVAPAVASAAPRGVEVRCTGTGTTVTPRLAEVRMGGGFLHVRNTTRKTLRVSIEVGTTRAPWESRGIGPGRVGWMRFALPPGEWRIACIDDDDRSQDPPSSPGYRKRLVPLQFVDPHGWYRTEALGCDSQSASVADYVSGTPGERDVAKLPALVREAIEYARPTDVVGDAGYAVRPAHSGPNFACCAARR
jgi:hypothetical protein